MSSPKSPSSSSSSTSSTSSSSSSSSKSSKGTINIYFGSQTGTAEGFARQIEADSNGYDVDVKDLEDFDTTSLEEELDAMKAAKVNVFLMATYGEGEPTDNATEFIKIIAPKKNVDKTPPDFKSVSFAVFGLGNTQYEFYNATGKVTDKKLEDHGGTRLLSLGIGDDDKSMEEDWEAWKEKFWTALEGPGGSKPATQSSAAPSKLKLSFDYNKSDTSTPNIPSSSNQANSTKYYFDSFDCACAVNKELRKPADGGSTKHIEVTLPSSVNYNTADNAAVLPHNSSAVVAGIESALNLDGNESFVLTPHDGKHVFPTPCTVTTLLTKYTDLTSPLRRADLKALSSYCLDVMDVKVLLRLASKEGKAEYLEKIEKPQVRERG